MATRTSIRAVTGSTGSSTRSPRCSPKRVGAPHAGRALRRVRRGIPAAIRPPPAAKTAMRGRWRIRTTAASTGASRSNGCACAAMFPHAPTGSGRTGAGARNRSSSCRRVTRSAALLGARFLAARTRRAPSSPPRHRADLIASARVKWTPRTVRMFAHIIRYPRVRRSLPTSPKPLAQLVLRRGARVAPTVPAQPSDRRRRAEFPAQGRPQPEEQPAAHREHAQCSDCWVPKLEIHRACAA